MRRGGGGGGGGDTRHGDQTGAQYSKDFHTLYSRNPALRRAWEENGKSPMIDP